MYIESIKPGQVVKSIAGHDSGDYFAVMYTEGGYVYIADGKARKTASPKKKNPLHLSKTTRVIDIADITDKKLTTALRAIKLGADIAEESD